MATRKTKHKIGDEISFYQNKEVRTGTVVFIGNGFLSVYPCTAEVLGVDKQPMRDIEHMVEFGDII